MTGCWSRTLVGVWPGRGRSPGLIGPVPAPDRGLHRAMKDGQAAAWPGLRSARFPRKAENAWCGAAAGAASLGAVYPGWPAGWPGRRIGHWSARRLKSGVRRTPRSGRRMAGMTPRSRVYPWHLTLVPGRASRIGVCHEQHNLSRYRGGRAAGRRVRADRGAAQAARPGPARRARRSPRPTRPAEAAAPPPPPRPPPPSGRWRKPIRRLTRSGPGPRPRPPPSSAKLAWPRIRPPRPAGTPRMNCGRSGRRPASCVPIWNGARLGWRNGRAAWTPSSASWTSAPGVWTRPATTWKPAGPSWTGWTRSAARSWSGPPV